MLIYTHLIEDIKWLSNLNLKTIEISENLNQVDYLKGALKGELRKRWPVSRSGWMLEVLASIINSNGGVHRRHTRNGFEVDGGDDVFISFLFPSLFHQPLSLLYRRKRQPISCPSPVFVLKWSNDCALD